MSFGAEGYNGPGAGTRGCPDPAVLMALSGDALPEDVRASAEGHVARCPACQALAADLREIAADATVPSSLDTRVLGSTGTAWWKTTLPLAAVLVAAIALGVWWRTERELPAASVARVDAPAPAPVQIAGAWTVEKPALLLPLATALVVRGDEDASARALAAALAPYRRNDYEAAAASLQEVVTAHPQLADAWFYLGASRLLAGDPAAAREALANAEERGVAERGDEVQWLLATAEARTGDIASARTRLDRLCAGESALRASACGAVASLP